MSRLPKAKKHKTRSSSKTKCFVFGCFGLSDDHDDEEDVSSVISSRKSRCWFSWSKTRSISNTKTVPVNASVSGNRVQTPVDKSAADDMTSNGQPQSQTLAHMFDHDTEHQQQTRNKPEVATVRKDRNLRRFDSIKINTVKKRAMPISSTLHFRKNSRSQPGSPEPKFSSRPINPIITSNSAPNLARINREKRRGDSSSHPSIKTATTKSGAVVGVSIIMVTLVIMILFGRVYAIACTSAFFYFIPHLKTSMVETSNDGGVKNRPSTSRESMDSSEYKKKVVLEGFLDRNHKRL